MTNESAQERIWTIQFAIPDVPYSAMVIPSNLDTAGLAQAMADADAFRDAFLAAFGGPAYQQAPEQQQGPPPHVQSAAPQQVASNGAQPTSGLFCPNHPAIELVESAPQYQIYDEIDGQRVPAKFYCPGTKNGTGKNESIWRSKAIAR